MRDAYDQKIMLFSFLGENFIGYFLEPGWLVNHWCSLINLELEKVMYIVNYFLETLDKSCFSGISY